MKNITCIEDLRVIARRFDYTEAGPYAQETPRANREDMERINCGSACLSTCRNVI